MQPVRSYIHTQGVACAVINAVLNPAIAWLGNRRMAFVPLYGGNSILIDTAATCIVLSLLVSVFVTPATRRELRAGRITRSDTGFWESSALAYLPSKAWSFGLLIGVVAAAVITPLNVRDVPCARVCRTFFYRIHYSESRVHRGAGVRRHALGHPPASTSLITSLAMQRYVPWRQLPQQ